MDAGTIFFGIVGLFGVVLTTILFVVDFKRIKSFVLTLSNRHKVFIYGPRAAGKSTLITYLDTGQFSNRRHPTKVKSVANVATDLSGSTYERLVFKKIVEVGGEFVEQLKPEFQKLSPEAIIFIYDLNNIDEGTKRLDIFLEVIEVLLGENSVQSDQIKAFLLVANKADQVPNFDYGTSHNLVESKLTSQTEKVRRLFIDVEIFHEVGSLRNSALRMNIDEGIRQLALRLRSK